MKFYEVCVMKYVLWSICYEVWGSIEYTCSSYNKLFTATGDVQAAKINYYHTGWAGDGRSYTECDTGMYVNSNIDTHQQ